MTPPTPKPRDTHGNDMMVPCTWLATVLYHAKYGEPEAPEGKKTRNLSFELYSVINRHWKEWSQ